MTKTLMELTREGASFDPATTGLIELPPVDLDPSEPWVVHMQTGHIEALSPMMWELGNTFYRPYDPTPEELGRLAQGQVVVVSRAMLNRLTQDDDQNPGDKLILPDTIKDEQRTARAARLHGTAAAAPKAPKAAKADAPKGDASASSAFLDVV
jgi:hypothetical protein